MNSALENDTNDGQDVVEKKHYFRGTIGALLGALIGAIPWAVVYFFGWFVGWLGFLIGLCASKGYELFGGKSGLPKAVIIIFATIIGVLVGQVMGDFISIGQMIAAGEIEGATYADIPGLYYYVISNEPEFLGEVLKNLLMGFAFAALGVWGMIKAIIADSKPAKPMEE